MAGGRPSKLEPGVKQRLLEAIKAGSHYEPACAYAHISYQTFRNWMIKGESQTKGEFFEFFEAIKEAESQGELQAIATIKAASKDDWKAASWMLERRHPQRWANTQRVKVEVDKKVEEEFNLFFEAIATDPDLPADVKRRVIETATNLQSRAAVANEN